MGCLMKNGKINFKNKDLLIKSLTHKSFNKENNNEFKSRIKQFSNYFLSVGRLTKQKNYSYLISEFANFLKYNKNEKLLIIGEGEEKQQLKKLWFFHYQHHLVEV